MCLYHIYSNYICTSQLESKWFLFFPSSIYSGRHDCVEMLPLLLQLEKLLCCTVIPLLSQISTITNENLGSLVACVTFFSISLILFPLMVLILKSQFFPLSLVLLTRVLCKKFLQHRVNASEKLY